MHYITHSLILLIVNGPVLPEEGKVLNVEQYKRRVLPNGPVPSEEGKALDSRRVLLYIVRSLDRVTDQETVHSANY